MLSVVPPQTLPPLDPLVPDWTHGSSMRGKCSTSGLSTRGRCSTHGSSPHGVLKQKVVPDWTRESSPSGALKQGVVPDCTRGSSTCGRCSTCGSSPRRALKTGRCSKLDPQILFSFLTQCHYPHTLSESLSPVCGIFLTQCHYPHTSRESVSPVGGIFLFFYFYSEEEILPWCSKCSYLYK